MGREFFMARTSVRSEKRRLPSNEISPTLTFGPSSTTKIKTTALGGTRRVTWATLAYMRPRWANIWVSTTSARRTRVGSYCISTERPTRLSRNPSRMSDCWSDFTPS